MSIKQIVSMVIGLMYGAGLFLGANVHAADKPADTIVYDAAAYTSHLKETMEKLDKLYLDFCNTCKVDGANAAKARQEFLVTASNLMDVMNAKFDDLEPEKGAGLSSTETLVSIHVLTMLVDILAETQLQEMAGHPYVSN